MSLRDIIYTIHSQIDQRLKFPRLKRGGIGVQVGFNMTYPLTSDLFKPVWWMAAPITKRAVNFWKASDSPAVSTASITSFGGASAPNFC